MASLANRLRDLGVQIGARNLPPPAKKNTDGIEHLFSGVIEKTIYGDAYYVPHRHELLEYYGNVSINLSPTPELIASWANEPGLVQCSAADFAFLDTETTGLSGGAGVLAFMVGIARFFPDHLEIRQYFLREAGEEPAMLAAISSYLGGVKAIVTFNGKSFDLPIMLNRAIITRIGDPFQGLMHIDLLHLARKLWKVRLPSRTLIQLEGSILDVMRSEEDVPGWVIPQLYTDYLHTGDARLLKNVFYHNKRDVLAMVALLNYLSELMRDPLGKPETPALDLLGIASILENLNRLPEASQIYQTCLQSGLPDSAYWETARKLSYLYKKLHLWENAIQLWQSASSAGWYYSFQELSKYYEHQIRDFQQAYEWALRGLDQLHNSLNNDPLAEFWENDLEHRLQRLKRKLTG